MSNQDKMSKIKASKKAALHHLNLNRAVIQGLKRSLKKLNKRSLKISASSS